MANTLKYTFLLFGLVWYFLQALTTSDIPLLGEKKSREGQRWFGLVCFFLQAMTTSDLHLLGEKKSWDGEDCGAHFSLVWFGFLPCNDDLWLTSPRWEEEQGRRGLWSTLFFGLVWLGISSKQWRPLTYLFSVRRIAGMESIDLVWFWYFLQAMTTSDLPLLGEKKSWDDEHCEAHFLLVWFGMVCFTSHDDLWLTSPWVRRRAGMGSIDLVWFGISSKQWRPLTYP